MIVIIDNYDSFTYNLYQYIGEINPDIRVIRNDQITVAELKALSPSHLIISPGPGFPQDAGISIEAIKAMAGEIPILGVCLGHQAIGMAFGGNVIHAPQLMHGKASDIHLGKSVLFEGLSKTVLAGRYHSLIVEKVSLPGQLKVTADTKDGDIMALEHTQHPVFGLQFHPESILTPYGMRILENFLEL